MVNAQWGGIFFVSVFVLFFSFMLNAQSYNNRSFAQRDYSEGHVFIKGGPAYCFGDAFGSPFAKSIFTADNFTGSVGFRNSLSDYLSITFQADYARYANSDSELRKHSIGLYASKSEILKGIFRTELQIPINKRFRYDNNNSIFFFAGVGGAYGVIRYPVGAYVGLPEVSTVIVPFGFGYSYALSNVFKIGVEFCAEYTYSDYFDGYYSSSTVRNFNDVLVSSSVFFSVRVF